MSKKTHTERLPYSDNYWDDEDENEAPVNPLGTLTESDYHELGFGGAEPTCPELEEAAKLLREEM